MTQSNRHPWCAIISCPNFVPCARARRRPSLVLVRVLGAGCWPLLGKLGTTATLPLPRPPACPALPCPILPYPPLPNPRSHFAWASLPSSRTAPPTMALPRRPSWGRSTHACATSSRLFVEPSTPGVALWSAALKGELVVST